MQRTREERIKSVIASKKNEAKEKARRLYCADRSSPDPLHAYNIVMEEKSLCNRRARLFTPYVRILLIRTYTHTHAEPCAHSPPGDISRVIDTRAYRRRNAKNPIFASFRALVESRRHVAATRTREPHPCLVSFSGFIRSDDDDEDEKRKRLGLFAYARALSL